MIKISTFVQEIHLNKVNHLIQLFLSLQNSLSHTQPEICLAIVTVIILLSCKGTDAVNDFVNYTCV